MRYLFLLLFLSLTMCTQASAGTKLLRFPDIHEDTVVFCYAGDIWRASVEGGSAVRLTAHPGMEVFPKFSPDGSKIAFTGQYDGDEQVYVIDAQGGVPKQLTYYPAQGPLPDRWGFDNQVYGWAPDGKSVLFRSMRHGWTLTDTRLYTVGIDGGLPKQLPMSVSGAGDFSPDGESVVFSPLTRDFRTWKRYEGGWAQDLYTFDLQTSTTRQITDHERTDRDPMWIGDRIYFSSDRSGYLNLYSVNANSAGDPTVVTKYVDQDVRWPSMGGSRIVFELSGELRVLNTESQEITELDIEVPTDGLAARQRRIRGSVQDYALSPSGKRVVVVARGDIFSVPAKKGTIRNLTRSSAAHDKAAVWSPDGKSIAFISDESGEEELYVIDSSGKQAAIRLTQDGRVMRHGPSWSPDSKSIALGDKDGRLTIVDVESKSSEEIADDKDGRVSDFTWSPHSGHLAFSLTSDNGLSSIHIWSKADKQVRKITGDDFNEYEPVWDPDGNYLYYLSDREFAPQIGNTEWNFVQNRSTGIFALALREDVEHPYPPEEDTIATDEEEEEEEDGESDESESESGVQDAANDDEDKDESGDEEDESESPIEIDFDGLARRVAKVPVDCDNLYGLYSVDGHLLYASGGAFFYGRESNITTDLYIFSHEDREESILAEDVSGYTISPDASKIMYRSNGDLHLMDTKPDSKPESVSTSRLMVDVVPREEWKQIFHEVWRRFRDYFYVDNMHGYDWQALRDKYEPLLEHVNHRADLNYVIGEMIGELNVGHRLQGRRGF